jgi:hypothetical protein
MISCSITIFLEFRTTMYCHPCMALNREHSTWRTASQYCAGCQVLLTGDLAGNPSVARGDIWNVFSGHVSPIPPSSNAGIDPSHWRTGGPRPLKRAFRAGQQVKRKQAIATTASPGQRRDSRMSERVNCTYAVESPAGRDWRSAPCTGCWDHLCEGEQESPCRAPVQQSLRMLPEVQRVETDRQTRHSGSALRSEVGRQGDELCAGTASPSLIPDSVSRTSLQRTLPPSGILL